MADNLYGNGTPGDQTPRSPNVKPKFVVNIDTAVGTPVYAPAPTVPPAASKPSKGIYLQSAVPQVPAAKPASTAAKSAPKKKANAKLHTRSMVLTVLFVVLTLGFAFWGGVCLNDVLAITRTDEQVYVTVPQGIDTKGVMDLLKKEGLIRQKWFCKLFYKVTHPKTQYNAETYDKYMPGVYLVKRQEGLEGLLNTFKSAPATAKTVRVVFPEGYTTYQIVQRLEEMGVCKQSQLYAALNGTDFDLDVLSSVPKGDTSRVFRLEGYFFPAQYDFYEGDDPNNVLRRMLEAYSKQWTAASEKKAKALGRTMDEIVTIASIIEKEAADAGQMPGISAVLHNRLKSADYPSVGCDSTKKYITNFAKVYLSAQQQEAYAKVYATTGTDAHPGLPPGPICNPGKAAIDAALNPESPDGKKYYFFQHDKKRNIYYSTNYSDFQRQYVQLQTQN
ncbi:MAG: endolytic transglycosylase MltG [Oscillospiraceae bacterium]|jgi:UPF0755 protein|nr:endolytic transglycosylase MltG [Oscillospiraceae bacterium]